MTTKLTIKNGATSNGDVNVSVKCRDYNAEPQIVETSTILPGKTRDMWIATGHVVSINETHPTKTPANEQARAGERADDLIAVEVAVQDAMWGDANERADSVDNQLIRAGMAQLGLTLNIVDGVKPAYAVADALLNVYPEDWDGLRSYGSTIANLVVAAAFIRSEIKRRLLLGEDTTRTKRGEAYTTASPYISAEEALSTL